MWEAFEHAALREARQPDRDHRRQPARPAGRDDARLGPRRLRRPGRGVRLARDRDRRPRRRRHRRRLRRGRERRTGGRRSSSPGRSRARASAPIENKNGWHGKAAGRSRRAAIAELGGDARPPRRGSRPPTRGGAALVRDAARSSCPATSVGADVATRKAYGDALAALGASRRPDVVALDGEVGNSTYAEIFGERHPDRFFEMYIAEQQMVASAVGIQVRGWKPFASTFAAFLTPRLRLHPHGGGQPRRPCRCAARTPACRSARTARRRWALEDLAMMRAVHGSTVLYPCDANQTAQLVAAMADLDGHLLPAHDARRRRRSSTAPTRTFPIGGSRVLRQSDDDQVDDRRAPASPSHEALAAARGARGRGDLGAGHRLLLDQAHRRRRPARGRGRDRRGS